MAELITWCRIMRIGPVCPTPCDDCRITSRRLAVAQQSGLVPAFTLAQAQAEFDGVDHPSHTETTEADR